MVGNVLNLINNFGQITDLNNVPVTCRATIYADDMSMAINNSMGY